jgi:hypothetical protein
MYVCTVFSAEVRSHSLYETPAIMPTLITFVKCPLFRGWVGVGIVEIMSKKLQPYLFNIGTVVDTKPHRHYKYEVSY